jgi:hypothetical protein
MKNDDFVDRLAHLLIGGFFGVMMMAAILGLMTKPAAAASCSSYPFTLQNNTTADATQVMANFNNVRNCVINNAAGSGVNTDITSITGLSTPLSVAQGGTPVFIGTTSTGSANAQVVASTNPIGYSLTNGYRVTFTAGSTNTGAATLNVNSTGATAVNRVGHAGLEALTGGEMVAGNIVEAIYNGTVFVLLNDTLTGIGTRTNIATGSTVDLGTVPSHNARITSSGGTITSFGSTAVATDPVYLISFAGANTLTYNATSMIIPGATNITTAADDTAVVEYLGSGNWQVLSYTKASGAAIVGITPLCGANGLFITNGGTPDTQAAITAGSAVLVNPSNGITIYATSVSVTINETVTGANGLDAGALGNNTFYHHYLISNGAAVAGLSSLSATAPTMPSGYIYLCRMGASKTNASAQFYRWLQTGNVMQFVVDGTRLTTMPTVTLTAVGSNCNVGGLTWAAQTVRGASGAAPLWAPPTAVAVNVIGSTEGAGDIFVVAPNTNYAGTASTDNRPPLMNSTTAATTNITVSAWLTLEADTIQVCTAEGVRVGVYILAYRDSVNAN